VILIEIPEMLMLKANNVPMFTCQLGTSRGNLAVKVIEPVKRVEE